MRNTNRMIAEAVGTSMQVVNERAERIDEHSKTLTKNYVNAQLWEAVMGDMRHSEQQAFIKKAQEAARRQGRKLPDGVAGD